MSTNLSEPYRAEKAAIQPEPAAVRTLLVVGATGLVGAAAVSHFSTLPGWKVVTLSRRAGAATSPCRHVRADLRDPATLRQAGPALGEVTHVLYTALYEQANLVAGWTDTEQIDINRQMLQNLLDELARSSPRLQHLTLLQGTKAYGSHVGAIRIPAKERDPRLGHPIFYWAQEDLLKERQRNAGWAYTVLRPQIILGASTSSPMNIVAAIGVYASLLRERGEPLHFPGGGRYLNACSDSRLIARAVEFAATHPVAANETYNVVNGDVLLWQDIWPSLAAVFGMEVGEHTPMCLAREMPPREDEWRALATRHGLVEPSMATLVQSSWQFADRNFGYGLEHPDDRVVSPIKLRKAGFADCEDTEDSLVFWLKTLQAKGYLPT